MRSRHGRIAPAATNRSAMRRAARLSRRATARNRQYWLSRLRKRPRSASLMRTSTCASLLIVGAVQHLAVLIEPGERGAVAERHVEIAPTGGRRRARRSSSASSSSHPSPVTAESGTASSIAPRLIAQRLALLRRGSRSILLSTSIEAVLDRLAEPQIGQHRMHVGALRLGVGMMRRRGHGRSRSASITSSSVARKAATRWVGRSEMKPTVSERIALRPDGSFSRRMVGSRVANSMVRRRRTSARVRRLNSVDLPALV